jgi:hypothetical protein
MYKEIEIDLHIFAPAWILDTLTRHACRNRFCGKRSKTSVRPGFVPAGMDHWTTDFASLLFTFTGFTALLVTPQSEKLRYQVRWQHRDPPDEGLPSESVSSSGLWILRIRDDWRLEMSRDG